MKDGKCLVVFSGGQDSTTVLGWALKEFADVEAITFVYGQRHSVEVKQAKKICEMLGVKQKIVEIDFLSQLTDSALVFGGENHDVNKINDKGLPSSFVPNRNQTFITLAHTYAQQIGAENLALGVCQTDYSGYPDCRADFIHAIEYATNLGSQEDIKIHTPLMYLTKAQTFKLAEDVEFLDLVLEYSHTCYKGDHETRHSWGYGCGECPACKLREKGYKEFLKLN